MKEKYHQALVSITEPIYKPFDSSDQILDAVWLGKQFRSFDHPGSNAVCYYSAGSVQNRSCRKFRAKTLSQLKPVTFAQVDVCEEAVERLIRVQHVIRRRRLTPRQLRDNSLRTLVKVEFGWSHGRRRS